MTRVNTLEDRLDAAHRVISIMFALMQKGEAVKADVLADVLADDPDATVEFAFAVDAEQEFYEALMAARETLER